MYAERGELDNQDFSRGKCKLMKRTGADGWCGCFRIAQLDPNYLNFRGV